jgi:hypothetical protein
VRNDTADGKDLRRTGQEVDAGDLGVRVMKWGLLELCLRAKNEGILVGFFSASDRQKAECASMPVSPESHCLEQKDP